MAQARTVRSLSLTYSFVSVAHGRALRSLVCASVRASRRVLARSSLRSAAASVRALAQPIAMVPTDFGVRDWGERCDDRREPCPSWTIPEGEQAKDPGAF